MEAMDPTLSERHIHPFYVVVIIMGVTLLVGVVIYFYGTAWFRAAFEAPPPTGHMAEFVKAKRELAQTAAAAGFGSELYEKSANPIADRMPDTAAPLEDPLAGLYTNPFE